LGETLAGDGCAKLRCEVVRGERAPVKVILLVEIRRDERRLAEISCEVVRGERAPVKVTILVYYYS